jgi:hypothetical protein
VECALLQPASQAAGATATKLQTQQSVTLPRITVGISSRIAKIKQALLGHVKLARARVGLSNDKLTTAHLRLKIRSSKSALTSTALIAKDDATLRTAAAALKSTAKQTTSGSSAGIGCGMDSIAMVVEVLPAPQTITSSDLVLKLRELRRAAASKSDKEFALGASVDIVLSKPITVGAFASAIVESVQSSGTGQAFEAFSQICQISLAKAPGFGPPVTATSALTLPWEPLCSGASAEEEALPIPSALSANLAILASEAEILRGLRDNAVLLWRRDTPAQTSGAAASTVAARPWTRKGPSGLGATATTGKPGSAPSKEKELVIRVAR